MSEDMQPVYPVGLSLGQDAAIGWSLCKGRIGLLCYFIRYSFFLFLLLSLVGICVLFRKLGFRRKFFLLAVGWIMVSYVIMAAVSILLSLFGGYIIWSDVPMMLEQFFLDPFIMLSLVLTREG